MAKIVFIDPDGVEHGLDVELGQSLMKGAFTNSVPGILAECGGACACGTCMVEIDPAWADRVPPPEVLEQSMLESYEEDGERRLSCQIVATGELDGLVVRVVAPKY